MGACNEIRPPIRRSRAKGGGRVGGLHWVLPVRDGARHDPHIHLRRPGALQDFRKLMQSRAAGHDVIHHGDVLAAQILIADESAFYVRVPCIDRQGGLRRGVQHALGEAGSKRVDKLVGDDFGDLQRLIEAAHFQP